MKLNAVLFDLDGTLLPMDQDLFMKYYFGELAKKLVPLGYSKDTLVADVWTGTKAMVMNDGSKTNEQAFWELFESVYGKERLKDKELFDDFYVNEFNKVKVCCHENPYAREIVDFVKSKGLKLILATNPLFPYDGQVTRLSFIGLKEDDFDYITSYETSCYAKPNPLYYQEILDKCGLNANEVIFFGNSERDDVEGASKLGIDTTLVGDYLIKSENKINCTHIKLNEVIKTIEEKIEKHS